MARNRLADTQIKVDFHIQSAEEPFPLPDESIDTIVSTWALCSIPDVLRAFTEMRRVLMPRGSVIFVEHGRSPDAAVVKWQDRITPVWKRFRGGCHLNRKIDDLITGAGLDIIELKTCYLPGPRPMTFTYQGLAVRR